MYLLDTDIATLIFYGRTQRLNEKLKSIVETEKLAISVVTRAEILIGRFDALRKAANGGEWLTAQTRLDEVE